MNACAPDPAAGPAAAFELLPARGGETAVVFASPHSGRVYPEALTSASRLGAAELRRSEDAFVDRLVAGAPGLGVSLLRARYARAYVDLNREPYELDPAMFEDDLPAFARPRTARVAAGIGAIARVVGEGQEIYARKLTFAEARERIEAVHAPYHAALAALIEAARARWGACVLVDWHSMPAAAGRNGGRRTTDLVLGDRFGGACASGVTALVEATLARMGYAVARNTPYAGGYTTETYGRPGRGVHALQIEINRDLYLDEATLQPTAGFGNLAANLERLTRVLAETDWSGLRP